MNDGSRVATLKSGSGALIYYQGASEPETSSFLDSFLKPGMIFIDAGAHIGEYTVRASRLVGSSGEVHAFEPAPETFSVLEQTVDLNRLTNVRLNRVALFNADTSVPFQLNKQPTLSAISRSHTGSEMAIRISVLAQRLDSYWRGNPRSINLVKVDVEGAELDVLQGASFLHRRPFWIFEYSSDNYSHHGHEPARVLDTFRQHGYTLWLWDGLKAMPLEERALTEVTSTNIIASPGIWDGVIVSQSLI